MKKGLLDPPPVMMRQISVIFFITLFVISNTAFAEFQAKEVFTTQCFVCHNLVGGDKIGPELKGITKRRSLDWITKFVKNPQAMIDAGDQDAAALVEKYKIVMTPQNLSDTEIKELMTFIETEAIEAEKNLKLSAVEAFGGQLFTQQCQTCHQVSGQELGGPNLKGITTKRDLQWLFSFTRSPTQVIESGDAVAKELLKKYNNILMPDSNLKDVEIHAILKYIESGKKYDPKKDAELAMTAIPQELNAPKKPFQFPWLNDNEGYAPKQPIEFSHKLHAGDNKIACQYCHYGAEKSRHAGIPAVGVCMNCHSVVKKDSFEIAKVKEAFDKKTSIAWVRVHKLPDFVYFSHERHVKGGRIECQTCHGEVQEMERLQQVSSLNMGWCVNCHRDTEVDVHADFYDFVKDKNKKTTVSHVGGLDCAKCHY